MKRIVIMCLLVVFAHPTWSLAGAFGPARVSFVDGDALFRAPDVDEWLPVTVNTPLDEGDAFWCPDGSQAEIQLADGSVVRLDGGSQLDLLANEDGFMHLHLASGHLYLRTAQTMKNNSLQIDADDTTVLPSARTRLRIDMLPNSLEDVAIIKGSAYVEGNGSRTRVRAGEHILLEEGHSEVLPLNPADSWEIWNVDRDRAQSRSVRVESHLPDELRGNAAELDANGTWVYAPEYGTVWRPTVILSNDWAPYRDGRWIWRGDDYVWLSFETWGWAPYHYGRWAVVRGFGWCWVPPVRGDVFWGPGYVGWYRTGSHVGWTPLAPGEKFYGHRNYGSNSVNITNVTINTGNINYKNRSHPGGLTVMPQNDFLRGRTVNQFPARNSSVSVSVSIGSPRIQPLHETRMPIVKQTPPRVAPPKTEYRDNHELRNRFPRIVLEPAQENRRQQPTPLNGVPATPTPRTPQVREKQTTFPTVVPAEYRSQPDKQQPQSIPGPRDDRRERSPASPIASQTTLPFEQPRQPGRQQTDERRQGEKPPHTASQPAPPATQSTPPASGSDPQRTEQPRRADTPVENQYRPGTTPTHMDSRPVVSPSAAVPPKTSAPQHIGQPRREAAPKDVQKRKTWKVTAPETVNEKEPQGKDNRGKERKEK